MVEEVEAKVGVDGEGRLAGSDCDRGQEEVDLVDQVGFNRLGGQRGADDADLAVCGLL